MPDPVLPEVRPGQIISASFVNQLIAKLTDLERRVVDLEVIGSTGDVKITGFTPSVQQMVGQPLTITGFAFVFPSALNVVTVDSVQVTEFRQESNTTKLEFLVPPLIGDIPPAGRNVVVGVRNANGSVRRMYTVMPGVPATGDPPIISRVSDSNGNIPVLVGESAIITGQHFSTVKTDNQISLSFTINGQPSVIPKDGDAPLTVDEATAERLVFAVPDSEEFPVNTSVSVVVRVRVGAHAPAEKRVAFLRSS